MTVLRAAELDSIHFRLMQCIPGGIICFRINIQVSYIAHFYFYYIIFISYERARTWFAIDMYYTQIVAFPLEAMKLTNHSPKFFEVIVNAPSLGFHFNVHYRSCKDIEKEVTVFYHANVLLSQIKITNS